MFLRTHEFWQEHNSTLPNLPQKFTPLDISFMMKGKTTSSTAHLHHSHNHRPKNHLMGHTEL